MIPVDYHFPDKGACEQANRDATFRPQTHEDGLPWIEIDGFLVFAYLDHKGGTVRISVHLDSPDERLIQPDGTVPLRVMVEDEVVYESSAENATRCARPCCVPLPEQTS